MPAGTPLGREPPEGPSPIPGGAPGPGPVLAEVRQHQTEAPVLPEVLIEFGVDFTGDQRR